MFCLRKKIFVFLFLSFLGVLGFGSHAVALTEADCAAQSSSLTLYNGICVPREGPGGVGLSGASMGDILVVLLNGLLGLVAVLAVLAFVASGIWYITAVGDEDRIDKAKEIMKYAIIGLIVALLGLIIVNAISTWLVVNDTAF